MVDSIFMDWRKQCKLWRLLHCCQLSMMPTLTCTHSIRFTARSLFLILLRPVLMLLLSAKHCCFYYLHGTRMNVCMYLCVYINVCIYEPNCDQVEWCPCSPSLFAPTTSPLLQLGELFCYTYNPHKISPLYLIVK